jgi:hypothetical protein
MNFESWKIQTLAILTEWHHLSTRKIPEAELMRRFSSGERPFESAGWLASQLLSGRLCEHDR